jgi:hypothetical protein
LSPEAFKASAVSYEEEQRLLQEEVNRLQGLIQAKR